VGGGESSDDLFSSTVGADRYVKDSGLVRGGAGMASNKEQNNFGLMF
jgi:hypothetical protein